MFGIRVKLRKWANSKCNKISVRSNNFYLMSINNKIMLFNSYFNFVWVIKESHSFEMNIRYLRSRYRGAFNVNIYGRDP